MSDQVNNPQRWAIREKWGPAVSGGKKGFFAVPDVLIKHQKDLSINSTEMVVLLNILMHWWDASDLPYPRPSLMARRIGMTTRTIERTIISLEKKGLIQRNHSEESPKGLSIRRFDVSGLVRKVNEFAERYEIN